MHILTSIITLCLSVSVLMASDSKPSSLQAQPEPQSQLPQKIYIIPVRDNIDEAIVYTIRRGVKEALSAQAQLLILDMNTNGGRVDKTQEIIEILNRFNSQGKIITYVNDKAFSAGAFIAAATQEIYLAPTAVIGAAAPVMMAPGSGPQEMPKAVQEKMSSAIRGMVRAQAQLNGHNPDVFDAMIDQDKGLVVAGTEIIPQGKLLTLTSQEAFQAYGNPPRPLLSAGTLPSMEALLQKLAGPNPSITRIEPTGFEQVGRFIVMLSPLLLSAALLCGYIEFKTPGFGFFGITAIVCALIFFFGHYIAGLSGYEFALIFFLGLLLILVELVFMPGTLLPGIAGLLLIFLSLLKAMVDKYPTDPFLPSYGQLQGPLSNIGLSLVFSIAGILILLRILPNTPLYQKLVLSTVNPSPLPAEASIQGLSLGTEGLTLSLLRPSGLADFGQGPVDVVAENLYIEAGVRIRVCAQQGTQIIVRPL
jgi:membrane-bound serine protease (ClpP class)